MAKEIGRFPPVTHHDEDDSKRQQLAQFDPDVERQEVGQQALRGNVVVEDLGGQTGAVKEAEDQRRGLGVGLEPNQRW